MGYAPAFILYNRCKHLSILFVFLFYVKVVAIYHKYQNNSDAHKGNLFRSSSKQYG